MSGTPQSHSSRGSRSSRRSRSAHSASAEPAAAPTPNNENAQQTPEAGATAVPLPPQIPPAQQAAMAFSGTGFNARWGPDSGTPPLFGQRTMATPGFPMLAAGAPSYMYAQQPAVAAPFAYPAGAYGGGYMGQPSSGFGSVMHTPVMTAGGGIMGHSVANPIGSGGGPRPLMTPAGRPQYPYPVIHSDAPSANMTNSTGGVGCEPGYNYFFPPEHTKIHFLKTGPTPPWHLPPGTHIEFSAAHVPCNITIGELMKGFGANNPNPQLNNITECICTGNGKWYKGMSFCGDVSADMGKTLKSVGWDSTRSGLPGGSPVVYLYITKD